MTITLPPELESRLLEQAGRLGEDAYRLAEDLIAQGLSDSYLGDDLDDLTAEQIAEIRIGIDRGLKAAAEGRVKPLAQAVAEARQRHGFLATWAEDIDKPRTML